VNLVRSGRRLGSALAAIVLLVSGAACSSTSAAGGATTLRMWTFKQTHVKALQAAADGFKQQTGITVNVSAYTPDDAFKAKLQSSAATKDIADVLEVHAQGEDFVLGGAGILADLTQPVDANWKRRFLPGTADAGLVTDAVYQRSLKPKAPEAGVKAGQLFSIPFTAGTFGIVYASKTKLLAAGLDPTRPPATWSELLSWLGTLKAKDAQTGGLTLGLKVSQTGFNWILQPLAYAYLGKAKFEKLFGQDAGSAFGGPDGQRALELYDQLTPYWTPGSQTLGIDDADRAFAQGKSAVLVGGTFTLAALQQDGMNLDDVLAFGLPAAPGGAVTKLKLAPIALTGLAMSSQTQHQDDVIKWMNYLTSTEQAGAFAQGSLDLPGTDLGGNADKLLGPKLAALESVFGADGPDTYNPGVTTFHGPTYDDILAGDALVKLSPLRETSPAQTNAALGTLIANSWK
jgi:multiple sugar transport system substrate-binding protein